ncbi:MAG TPA: hypothetical protein PLX15_05360 [Candidatus Woesearchaeota archaeon]|nr:hypothetical protein [Candidatus Woesearchaeota archaeon]
MALEENNEFFEEDDAEDMTKDDLLYEAHLKVDALIELLVNKKLITEEEYNDVYEKLLSEDLQEDAEDDLEEESDDDSDEDSEDDSSQD